jgi:CzcA family heavy metal efflux pump
MLKQIVEHSLRFRGIVMVLACIVVAYGIYVMQNAKLDVFPDFVQPQVTVQSEAPGLSPEQVEALVTRPVESVLNGAGNLESIRSESIEGLSVVDAVFKEGTDIYIARQTLSENLAQLSGQLPTGVKSPTMSPLTSSTMDLLKFGLTSDKLTPMQLRTFADWVVKPRLLSVQGVAGAKVFGGEIRQLQIQVHPEKLIAFGLTLQDVSAAAAKSTGVRGAGFIETPAQRIVMQTEGQSLTPEQMGNIVLTQHEGQSVRLKDVADALDGAEPPFGGALINGKPGVLMTTASQYRANTMDVTEGVEKALKDLAPVFASEGVTYVPALHRPATFIELAIHNMRSSLLLGTVLVAVILFLFLLDLRTAFISFTAIPLSLLAAVIVLNHFGVTLNTMTLGGLAVAIGVVVDDAIIDVENILRRLRENLTLPHPRSLFDVVLDASLEVRSAVVYASFIVALVFLPVLTMSGIQGRFFAPLGTAFILAIMASLGVALTLTPALSFLILSRMQPHKEPRYIGWLKSWHRGALARISKVPRITMAIALLLFAGAVAMLPFFGAEFLPDFREGHFVVQVSMAPGTSLEEMLRVGGRVSEELLKNPAIQSVSQQAGRAEMGEDTWGPQRCEFHVELKPGNSEQEAVQNQIQDTLAKFPGLQTEVLTFLGDRIGETISGETAPVVIKVFGEDLDVIDQKAQEISDVLQSIPGHATVELKAPPGAPRLAIRLRPDRMTQFGFRPVEVLEAIETAYEGNVVAQTYEGNRVFDVSVILPPEDRRDPETVGSLMLANSQGARMPLRELADVYLTTGRYSILHDGARRQQTITCTPSGRDVASFVADAQKQIAAKVQLPSGVYLEFSGAAEEQTKARNELLFNSAIAFVGIVILLAILFRNARNLLLVLANVPFALVGGVIAIFLTGMLSDDHQAIMSLGTLVGFVTLFGLTMRNSIMMISHFEHLVRQEGMTWGLEAAIRGADERLVPILMTALVTGLGLLPLAIGSGEAGREIEGPMAIVILGGLITSTLLNLLVLPMLALRYGRFEKMAVEP